MIKHALLTDFTKSYRTVYREEKSKLLESIEDPEMKERVGLTLPTETSLRKAAQTAKQSHTIVCDKCINTCVNADSIVHYHHFFLTHFEQETDLYALGVMLFLY